MTIKKLDYIDALRGVAVLGILITHTSQVGTSDLPDVVIKIAGEGARGVQLFYLVSAFTLFLSFKNRFTKEKFPIRNFFLRRFFRIAPLYYLGIAYYLWQNGMGARYSLGDETHVTTLNILSNITFMHGFNPYWINSIVPGGWSIGVEMTFYILLPYLFSKIKSLNQASIFFLASLMLRSFVLLFLQKFQLISDPRLWNEYLFFFFPNQLPIFALGTLLYFLVIEDESIQNISGKSILTFSILLLFQLITGYQFIIPNHILFGIGFLILAFGLSKFQFTGIVNPLVNYIGKISYSMYLTHIAVLHCLTHFGFIDYFDNEVVNYITRFFIVLILSILVSSILYVTIETPFQKLGKKIIDRLEKNGSAGDKQHSYPQ